MYCVVCVLFCMCTRVSTIQIKIPNIFHRSGRLPRPLPISTGPTYSLPAAQATQLILTSLSNCSWPAYEAVLCTLHIVPTITLLPFSFFWSVLGSCQTLFLVGRALPFRHSTRDSVVSSLESTQTCLLGQRLSRTRGYLQGPPDGPFFPLPSFLGQPWDCVTYS